MISVQEASSIIMNNLGNFSSEIIPLNQSVGRFLREDIFADQPFPSFDRVMMDGIAINYKGYQNGNHDFPIQEMQPAGMPKTSLENINHCIEVMTGAILPDNTDIVIPYEEVKIVDGIATVDTSSVIQWKNIHRIGIDREQGELLLSRNTVISPAEIATLAAVGKHQVKVSKLPQTMIISTGDELVDIDQLPATHQIRKSNTHALAASLIEMNIVADTLHLPDHREEIINQLKMIVDKYDVVILSGGVSKGKKDYIPEALGIIGVNKLFHKVKQRPGKPFWFGVKNNTTIFALPGNPVSTFLCFYKYVKPWLITSLTSNKPKMQYAVLAKDVDFEVPLTYFMQVIISNEKGKLTATPMIGKGSGDFTNLNKASGFLELLPNESLFKAGHGYPFISFRNNEV